MRYHPALADAANRPFEYRWCANRQRMPPTAIWITPGRYAHGRRACFWAAWTTPWTTIGATGTRFASDLIRFMLSLFFVFFAGGRPRQAEAPPSKPRGQFSDAEKACSPNSFAPSRL